MPTSPIARLDRLAGRFRPTACYSPGLACEAEVVVGDETPGEPDLPTRCPSCGRCRTYTVVRLVGVDARRL
ncbi:MAG: hypothetical protein M3Q10_17175 [Chloroflexota bacterium]|nr:hypothetical protein [Chloroflexota bacterium]